MDDHTRILEQLRRSYDGEPWHGPSLLDALDGVDARLAAARPLPGVHSIWEIARHVSYWTMVVRRRLAGEVVTYDADADWPQVTAATESAWLATRDVLEQSHRALERMLLALPAATLQDRVAGQRYTGAFMLHGLVQHVAYHAGQISLLKRAALEQDAGGAT
jgi:uncharacterized damage-inducible protein DinB